MRKTLLIIISIFSCQIILAQNKDFIIEGTAKNFPDNTIVKLRDTENNKWIDSVFISNQKFVLKAYQPKYNYASQYFLFVGDKNDVIPILVENSETLKLKFDTLDFPKHHIIKSKHQESYEKLDSVFYVPYTEIIKYNFIINTLKKQNSEDAQKNISQFQGLINLEKAKVDNAILNYKNDFVVLHYIANYINVLQPDKHILADFLKTLSEQNLNTKYAKAIQYYINQDEKYLEDEMFDVNNNKVRLSKKTDKNYILLDIASYYCGYSKNAKGNLEEIVNDFSDKLDVISIHVDNDLEGLKNYSTDKYSNWKFYYHPEGRFSNFFIKYRVIGTPSYYLFDKKGNLVSSWQNDENLKEKISTLIK